MKPEKFALKVKLPPSTVKALIKEHRICHSEKDSGRPQKLTNKKLKKKNKKEFGFNKQRISKRDNDTRIIK